MKNLFEQLNRYRVELLQDRFFTHETIQKLVLSLPSDFQVQVAGNSFLGKELYLIEWGDGPLPLMLWSQMHGDEATGTMALFDLFSFLQSEHPLVSMLRRHTRLYFLPLLNPDGAAVFSRRNAQQIDINRDFLETVSPEARLLKSLQAEIKPLFGFNLHDQTDLWSVESSSFPATLSFLAPSTSHVGEVTETRQKAMQVIAAIFKDISPFLPGSIGLFDDAFEPRSFGDNFQQRATATILIEAGGRKNDPEKQEIRQFYLASILSGLHHIVTDNYLTQSLDSYFSIPRNNKALFHYLIRGVSLPQGKMSIGINYEEHADPTASGSVKTYRIVDMGDLSTFNGYHVYDDGKYVVIGNLRVEEAAHFDLLKDGEKILSFKNGSLL